MRSSSCRTGFRARRSKAVQVLVEEVRKRSRIGWDVMIRWPTASGAGHRGRPGPLARLVPERVPGSSFRPSLPARRQEGFRIQTVDGGATPRRSWRSSATTPAASSSASAGCCASCAWRRASVACRTGSTWRRRPSTRSAGISSAIVPRPTRTTPGTWRSGSAISASWPSSAPTPSS